MSVSSENNFASLLLQHCEVMADKQAISIPLAWDEEKVLRYDELSFTEFSSRVSAYQQGMQQAGFVAGDRIVLMYPPNADMYCLVTAMMASAIVPVFIDTSMPRAKILMAIEDSHACAVISVKKLLSLKPLLKALWGKRLFKADDNGLEQLYLETSKKPEITACEPEQSCLITFTSGSTGRPKGADRTHLSLLQQHHALQEHIPTFTNDICLTCFPVSILHGLCCGVTSLLPAIDLSSPGQFNPKPVIEQINRLGVTTVGGAPAFLNRLMDAVIVQEDALSSVRAGVVGGAAVPKYLCEKLAKVFGDRPMHIVYGSTEAEPIASIEVTQLLQNSVDKPVAGLLVGLPCTAVQLKIVSFPNSTDPMNEALVNQCELEQGDIGEIVVKGQHVLKGYIDNPTANKENKIPCADGQVWHRTGDTGFLDTQGRIVLVGREKDKVQFEGQTLHPYLIEADADSLPELSRSALLDINGQAQLAYTLADGVEQAQAEVALMSLLSSKGWEGVALVLVEAIPVDGRHNSKVDRPKLREQLTSSPSRFIISLNRVDCLTLAGVVFAFASILLAIKGHFAFALSSLFVAMLGDALDGIWARKRGIERSFGRYLDGFVDELDYLIAPSVFLYLWGFEQAYQVGILLIFMMCGMVRLSVFNEVGNIKEDKGLSYLGMPVFWSLFILAGAYLLNFILPQPIVFSLLSLLLLGMSFMMVYKAPFFKFKSLKQILILVGSGISAFAIIGCLGG